MWKIVLEIKDKKKVFENFYVINFKWIWNFLSLLYDLSIIFIKINLIVYIYVIGYCVRFRNFILKIGNNKR